MHLKPAAGLIFLCALALKSCWAIVSLCPLSCCPFISMCDLVCLCTVRVCVASIERTESCLPWARWDKAPFGGHGGHQKTQKAPHYTTEWSRARAHSPGRQSHSHYWPGTPWGKEKYKSALKREKGPLHFTSLLPCQHSPLIILQPLENIVCIVKLTLFHLKLQQRSQRRVELVFKDHNSVILQLEVCWAYLGIVAHWPDCPVFIKQVFANSKKTVFFFLGAV